MDQVTFQFRAAPSDVIAPSLALAKRSTAARWWTLFWLALIVTAGVVSSSRPRGDTLGLWLMLAIATSFAVILLGSRLWLRYQASRSPRNAHEYTYTFSELGFTSRNDRGEELNWPWPQIPEVSEVQTAYLLLNVDGCRCLLPKRAISDAEAEQVFRGIVEANAPDRGSHLARERVSRAT